MQHVDLLLKHNQERHSEPKQFDFTAHLKYMNKD